MSRRKLLSTDNKYSRGIVVVCAGSKKYPGAALLSVGGARAGNAGYIKFFSKSRELSLLVVSKYPDVVPISELKGQRVDALLVGPGESSLPHIPKVPLVLDSAAISNVTKKQTRSKNQIIVITPHEGELKYLGESYLRSLQNLTRVEKAKKIANDFSVIVILKGAGTVVATPDQRVFIDEIGGAELATAGSGDLLAGLVASMLVDVKNESDPFELASTAVKMHSKAGRLAAKKFKTVTALEILDCLPLV
ncbi:MAG: ADP-dependent NAD(P)H-hydrate dehydratase [Candidatus Nanopelagicaceae bacterium]